MTREQQKQYLLSHPSELLQKKPFTRGFDLSSIDDYERIINSNTTYKSHPPTTRKKMISQAVFEKELDPSAHNCLYDDNIPSICVKLQDGSYNDIVYEKMAIPFQRIIKNKQVLHLAAKPLQFTLLETNPSEEVRDNYTTFKQWWEKRNQDGMKIKMVNAQLSYGDSGLLYYFNENNEVRCRLISYEDGYNIISHNDRNGERLLECVNYYVNDVEVLDVYDNIYLYRFQNNPEAITEDDEFVLVAQEAHGFSEIPLITKRGDVAWNNVQSIINSYEYLFNVFNAIQKRWGWGIFYVRGKFNDKARKIAGSIVLNDTSPDGNGDAKFLTPPTPEGMLNTLQSLEEAIQKGASTTFLLPKDVKMSGDISGIAIQLTQSMDIENALQKTIEWQNVADKMVRLFKEGLAKELVSKDINPNAVTEFDKLDISAKFNVWKPMNDFEYNQMLVTLSQNGLISQETGIECNTISKPDEKVRVDAEMEKNVELQQKFAVNNQTTETNIEDYTDTTNGKAIGFRL